MIHQKKCTPFINEIFADILPQDYWFKIGSIRQIGSYIKEITENEHNGTVVDNLVQSINEPLGHYFAWDLFDKVMDYYVDYYEAHKDDEKVFDELSSVAYRFQHLGFLKTVTSWWSIAYKSETFMAKYYKI